MKPKFLTIKYNGHVLSETAVDNRFYFYKEDYSKLESGIDKIVDICYNKYLVEKIRLGEIKEYTDLGLKINITTKEDSEIAKVEVSGIEIVKSTLKQKTKRRFI